MNWQQLQEFFEEHDFKVYPAEDYEEKENGELETFAENIELNTHTEGGVNMIICLEPPTPECFFEFVKYFNIDEEIDFHRRMKDYKKDFTISQSLKDFTKYKKRLNKVGKALKVKMKELSSEKV